MPANIFDQFDEVTQETEAPKVSESAGNPFNQFDEPSKGNVFDQFDESAGETQSPVLTLEQSRANLSDLTQKAEAARQEHAQFPGFARWLMPDLAEGADFYAKKLGLAGRKTGELGEAVAGDIGSVNNLSFPRTREAIAKITSGAIGKPYEQATLPSTFYPPGSIPAEVGKGIGQMAPALAATAAGVPAPIAFSAQMGSDAYVQSGGDPIETAKAAALGAVLPSVGKFAKGAAGQVMAKLRARGLGSRFSEKAVEELANQASMNALMNAANAPSLYEKFKRNPSEAWAEIGHAAGVNLGMSLLGIVKELDPKVRSETENIFAKEFSASASALGMKGASKAAEGAPPAAPAAPAAPALPAGVERAGTLAGRDQYHYTDPVVGKQTFALPAGSRPEVIAAKVADIKEAYRRDAVEGEPLPPEGPAVVTGEAAKASEPAAPMPAPSEAPKPAEGIFERNKITEVESASPERWQELAGKDWKESGGLTGKAHEVGRGAQTPEEVAELKAGADRMDAEAARLKAELTTAKAKGQDIMPILDAMAPVVTKKQFFREAYEAATGTGSAGDFLRKRDPSYQPPFPEGAQPKGIPNADQESFAISVDANQQAQNVPQMAEGAPGGVRQPERALPNQQEQAAQGEQAEPGEPIGVPRGTPQSPTGIKNVEMNRVRAEVGLPPLEETVGKPDAELWQRVMNRLDSQPEWVDGLVSEFKEKPRSHTDEEALALDHRLVELRTEHAKASAEAARAKDAGELDAASEAGQRATLWSDKIRELSEITKATGTIMGRAFRARQLMMNEDFSLAALESRKREANDWRPLTDGERAEIQKTHDDYTRKTAELEAHLNEQRAKLVDTELKLAQAEAAKGAQYEPKLLKIAEGIASFMDTQANAARVRLREKMGRTSAGVDPTILSDVAIIGAAKIARKISDFAKWSDAMLTDLGEWVRPHLQQAWQASQAHFEKTVDERLKTETRERGAKAKSILSGTDAATRIEDAKAAIASKAKKGELDTLYSSVQKLVRSIVEQDPSIAREPLIDQVHKVLQEVLPNISRLETMDAISGRGRFTLPRQDQVSKTVRDLKTQTRLVAHAMDVEAKRPLPRTGYQRGKISDIARNLQQQLNELKRKFGVTVTDPARQLASVLGARKTYYQHRLADLKLEIQMRERIVKTKTPSPTDAELEALVKEYKKTQAEHDQIFDRSKLTDEQRLDLAEKAAGRQIESLQRQLEQEAPFQKSRKVSTLTSEKLEAQRAQIEALKAERQWMRGRLQPGPDPLMQALQLRRAQLLRQVAGYQKRLADGDFTPRTVKPPLDITQDSLAMRYKAELEAVKRDFDRGLALDEAKKRTRFQKILAGAREVVNLPKAIWSAFDLSAVGRQGLFVGTAHPLRAAKSIVPMLRALTSEKRALIEEARILNRPNAKSGAYARSKLYLASLDEFRLSRQEEIMMSRYSNLIPGVRASNRAFMTYLNKLRADSFDAMLDSRKRLFSSPVTQAEMHAIANYVNVATGRGDIGRAAGAAETLATVFWAPRLVASRFQLLALQPLYRGSMQTRALIASEYARSLTGIGVMLGLGALAGGTIETDSNSTDFLKIKMGKSRIDVFGGLIQNTVLLSRLSSGKMKLSTGKEAPARAVPTLGNFARNKLTPALSTAADLRDILVGQKPPPGHAQTVEELLINLPVPLSFRDIFDIMRDDGVPEAAALQLLSTFGFGVQHYQ